MFLIASAAFVNDELQAEIGNIPPTFLPIGNKRLFERQINEIRKNSAENIYITVPKSYHVERKDLFILQRLNVELIKLSDGLPLGRSIFSALKIIEDIEGGESDIKILYGDTLIYDLPNNNECVAVSESNTNYNWMVEDAFFDKNLVWAGFFSFQSVKKMINLLYENECDYLKCVKKLANENKIKKVVVNSWLDLGHVNTYFQSRARITTQRYFNSLTIEKNIITKKSSDYKKILAEINWFKSVPINLKRLTPNLIDSKTDAEPCYSLEFLYYIPLNELLVHGSLPISSWKSIIDACREYFNEALSTQTNSKSLLQDRQKLIIEKTNHRLDKFKGFSPVDFKKSLIFNGIAIPSINEITEEILINSCNIDPVFSIIHGDFCFSNILYDSRSQSIKIIDPRGMSSDGNVTIYGDLVYDLAKFYHSVYGLYDFIISDCFDIDIKGQSISFTIHTSDNVGDLVSIIEKNSLIDSHDLNTVMPMVINLFLSMLPLHSDNPRRQSALLANALRLFCIYKGLI